MNEPKVYLFETINGSFISIGEDIYKAKQNFANQFPGEQITEMREIEERAFYLSE